MAGNTIGELNGKWAILFKFAQLITPFMMTAGLAWATWATSTIMALQPGVPRYTAADAGEDHQVMWRAIDARLDALPPNDWRLRITSLEDRQRSLGENQIKILLEVQAMQVQMEKLLLKLEKLEP